jgi:hypothetical protein
MAKNNLHVVKHNGQWAVKQERQSSPLSTHRTQSTAEKNARTLAKLAHLEVYLHGRDGKIRERNTYGHDPFPPRG